MKELELMKKRLDEQITYAICEYKSLYEVEFKEKNICDVKITTIEKLDGLRDKLRNLYWIKNKSLVDFDKDKIIVKNDDVKIVY